MAWFYRAEHGIKTDWEQQAAVADTGKLMDNADWNRMASSMVELQLRHRGIQDENILKIMRHTPRHLFLSADQYREAYHDSAMPILCEQTISQPYVVAKMTELLCVSRNDRVLEVGTGSGYHTAILASLGARVFTMDVHSVLVDSALIVLRRLGHENVEAAVKNGRDGWTEKAPFDRIVVSAATETVPPALVAQLAIGGRMVMPIGSSQGDQTLCLITRLKTNDIALRNILPVKFVPLV
jgi:protein-L-isoaspartate(D-aspartate) O-methyltransferase